MQDISTTSNDRQVSRWLLLGVVMIIIQVLIGGITRLTESGLSITEWKPITGTLPPLNDAAWQVEFDKYRNTDQFKYVHQYFSLSDFKFIFFWEWFHRLWARLLGLVFLAGFIYFVARKKISKAMISPLILLFVLGGLQGAIGWLMVKSGLVPEKYYVGHVELTTHLIAAIILLAYTFWFALILQPAYREKLLDKGLKNLLIFITLLFFVQLIYGGFMAGLKAAQTAPTWPDINGSFLPERNRDLSFWNDPLMIHFVHRGIAYVLFFAVLYFTVITRKYTAMPLFNRWRIALAACIVIQVVLGIGTVLTATTGTTFVVLGVAHQFVAMLIVICLTALLYLVRGRQRMV